MYKLGELNGLIHQAATGDVPPIGDVASADEVIGFAFGLRFDQDGQLGSPGPVNETIANFIVNDEVLRTKNMTLQEELAVAIEAIEPMLANQIVTLKTIKTPGVAYNTHELLMTAKPGLAQRSIGSLAVVAFRNHLPRAAAQVKKAGFMVSTPNMSRVGEFDPDSPQPWIRNPDAWIRRERKALAVFALANRI
jgi:hypothetical protein